MRILLTLLILLPLALAPAEAGKGKGKGKGHGRFRQEETRIMLEHYRPATGHVPPGLAKRSDLPPGIEKQLRRNGRLPPGIEKKLSPFPPMLAERMGPPPIGCRRAIYGPWALLIQDAGNVVLDIVELTSR